MTPNYVYWLNRFYIDEIIIRKIVCYHFTNAIVYVCMIRCGSVRWLPALKIIAIIMPSWHDLCSIYRKAYLFMSSLYDTFYQHEWFSSWLICTFTCDSRVADFRPAFIHMAVKLHICIWQMPAVFPDSVNKWIRCCYCNTIKIFKLF